MRNYELCLILHPDIQDETIDALISSVSDSVSKHKGSVLKVEKWGKKTLKHQIKKQNKGNYCFVFFSGDNDMLRDLDRIARYHENVLRYDIMRLPKNFQIDEPQDAVSEKKAPEQPIETGENQAQNKETAEATEQVDQHESNPAETV